MASAEKSSHGGSDEELKIPSVTTTIVAEKSLDDGAYVPRDDEEFIDPRLKDYPIPLVAKTVDLHNDPTEPILTFRFWVLSTLWTVVGCAVSTFYYFKPFVSTSLTGLTFERMSICNILES
ncbi:hypothetical protein AC578_9918 [Pseudocercospora eumusae]|uniref:Uncharacterized protein n=1 Tax=Pseudocercospora eumusae TaxID=321146 RepID=A0A139HBB6_9PEZI|nr:hypothetical protein AC578_9918 [Pseudocercospora eumusae]